MASPLNNDAEQQWRVPSKVIKKACFQRCRRSMRLTRTVKELNDDIHVIHQICNKKEGTTLHPHSAVTIFAGKSEFSEYLNEAAKTEAAVDIAKDKILFRAFETSR